MSRFDAHDNFIALPRLNVASEIVEAGIIYL